MNKISKLFCTGLALLSQSMCLVFGASNIDEPQSEKYIEQSVTSSEKEHKEESLAGTYVGWHKDAYHIHGLNLDISENNGDYSAVLSFYPLSYSASQDSGSFSMKVEQNDDGTYNFIQDQWINQPEGCIMIDLLNCTLSNSTITGDVFACLYSEVKKREIGYVFATTIEEELYGKYESWFWSGDKKYNLILTVEKSNGRPSAVLTSDALDTPIKYDVVPILAHGNYNFIAVEKPTVSPRMSVVFDALNCTLHGDILTGRISTELFGTVISCGPLTMNKVSSDN